MKSYFGGKFQTVATWFDFFAKFSAIPVFDYAVILRLYKAKNQNLCLPQIPNFRRSSGKKLIKYE